MPVDFDVFTSLMDGYMHLHVGCMIGMWNLGDPMQAVRCTCTIHIALAARVTLAVLLFLLCVFLLVDKVLETCIYRIVFLLILVACSVKINLHICAVQYIVKYVKLTVHLCCLNNFH